MGFTTPQPTLNEYLVQTTTGELQLPDFQRSYKWNDERIRSLLVTILRGHPMGSVMLLETGNDQIRFKPRPVEGVKLPAGTSARILLLDGQQRLTSITQALTGDGVVATKDSRGKRQDRCYYLNLDIALMGDEFFDDAVMSVPADRMIRSNFGRQIDLDLSTDEAERAARHFPLRLLFSPESVDWLFEMDDRDIAKRVQKEIIKPVATYAIPAIQLDQKTSKAAVATVFEKVNIGGLPLNVFELLTATFAGDPAYYAEHGTDFRLNDDWTATQTLLAAHPVLTAVESTDFLQAITLLATLKRNRADMSQRPAAISARKEDILRLDLRDYLEWVEPLRSAFGWVATFLADLHIFDARSIPYTKQLVPLAAIRVVLGDDADLHPVRQRLTQWFWCGVLGELYGGAIETRFARDIDQVPAWATGDSVAMPSTVQEANFVESRLHSLRTRNAAAYKGVYALVLGGARDWLYDKAFDKVQYVDMAVDIHHIFPVKWCTSNGVDSERQDSVVNKTPLAAGTNRKIGGAAPSEYLAVIERAAQMEKAELDALVAGHLIDTDALRVNDFDRHFTNRREALVSAIEQAMGKPVQRDVATGELTEGMDQFDDDDEAVATDTEDLAVVDPIDIAEMSEDKD